MMPLVQQELKRWRLKRRYSQNRAWKETGVRRSCIDKMEKGKPKGKIETLLWICDGYRAWPSEFFAEVERKFRRLQRKQAASIEAIHRRRRGD